MSGSIASPLFAAFGSSTDSAARPAPPPRPVRQPVFLSDVATPWAGETLLLALLRADLERLERESDTDRS